MATLRSVAATFFTLQYSSYAHHRPGDNTAYKTLNYEALVTLSYHGRVCQCPRFLSDGRRGFFWRADAIRTTALRELVVYWFSTDFLSLIQ